MPCTGSRLRRFGLGGTSPANLHGKEGSSESSPVRAARHYPWPRSRILVLLSGLVPKNGCRLWAVTTERCGSPVPVGKYPPGGEEGRKALLAVPGSLFPVCLLDTNMLSELRKVQSGKQVGMLPYGSRALVLVYSIYR